MFEKVVICATFMNSYELLLVGLEVFERKVKHLCCSEWIVMKKSCSEFWLNWR